VRKKEERAMSDNEAILCLKALNYSNSEINTLMNHSKYLWDNVKNNLSGVKDSILSNTKGTDNNNVKTRTLSRCA
jgi:hypothetical protein